MPRKSVRWTIPALLALVTGATPVVVGLASADHAPSASVSLSGNATAAAVDLDDPAKKDIAMQLVSSAENSSLDWKAQYKYIEDIGDGRGYTAGIIGFCSGTGDMLELVELYTDRKPGNVLAKYLPALRKVNGTDSHAGLDPNFTQRLGKAAAGHRRSSRPRTTSATGSTSTRRSSRARTTACGALGQFIYYDAIVMHGPGNDATSFGGIRKTRPAPRPSPRRRAATRRPTSTPSSTRAGRP